MAAKLMSFPGLKNNAASSKELPTRLKIFEWGRNKTLKGDIIVDERSLKVFEDVQRNMGRDTLALDFEHNTVAGTPANKESQEPRPVAAHMVCSIVPQDGVYCDVKDWTEHGQKMAKNYKDLSPVPWTLDLEKNGDNVLVGMHSVALTQTGAFPELTFLTADGDTPFKADLMALSSTVPAAFQTGSDANTKGYSMENMKVLKTFLGMSDETPDETAMSCMAEAIKGNKIVRNGPLDHAGGTTPGVMPYPKSTPFSMQDIEAAFSKLIDAKLTPLSTEVKAVTTAAANATAAAEQSRRDALVAQATREFKVIPLSADEIKVLPIGILESLVKGLPKTSLTARAGQPPLIKAGDKGQIQAGKTITLSIDGQQVPISINGDAPRKPAAGLRRTAQLFNEQLASNGLS